MPAITEKVTTIKFVQGLVFIILILAIISTIFSIFSPLLPTADEYKGSFPDDLCENLDI